MKKLLLAIMIVMGCISASPAFAEDYHERNFFNHLSDWSITFWKAPDERRRVIDERIDRRAHWREMRHHEWEHAHDHDHDRWHDHDHH